MQDKKGEEMKRLLAMSFIAALFAVAIWIAMSTGAWR